jgi:F0F1-type ATP synthase epsilon subunit
MLQVTIRDRTGEQFAGPAKAVTCVNEKGRFDVLSQHANFISTIKDKVTIHLPESGIKEFNFENGVIQVSSDNVVIYLGVL